MLVLGNNDGSVIDCMLSRDSSFDRLTAFGIMEFSDYAQFVLQT